MSKIVAFDPVEDQKKAIDSLELAVGATLGPRGHFVQIYEDGEPTITNDGVTVAKNFELPDPIANSAVDLVRQASIETNERVGDGTTAAIVLANAFINRGWKLVKEGVHPYEVKMAFDTVSDYLKDLVPKLSRKATDEKTLVAVASLAANNDKTIGKPVGELIKKLGIKGTAYIDENEKMGIDTDLIEGYSFNSGVASHYFLPQGIPVASITKPSLLLYDGRLVSGRDMFVFLEKMQKAGVEQLVIICREIDGEALKVAATNKIKGDFDVTVINAPGYSKMGTTGYLQDLSVLTGAEVIAEESGVSLQDVTYSMCGTAESISTRLDKTLILFEKQNKETVAKHVKYLEELRKDAGDTHQRTQIDARIEALNQKTGVVKIGSDNPVALRDMQFRADDAIHAASAAQESGVVPGGGVTLARIAWGTEHNLGTLAKEIIKALDAPLKRIITNAAKDERDISARLGKLEKNMVWDAANDIFVDCEETGILDPTDVVLTSATQALKVAGMIMTTAAVIVREKRNDR